MVFLSEEGEVSRESFLSHAAEIVGKVEVDSGDKGSYMDTLIGEEISSEAVSPASSVHRVRLQPLARGRPSPLATSRNEGVDQEPSGGRRRRRSSFFPSFENGGSWDDPIGRQAAELFGELDADGDGKLTMDEFRRLMHEVLYLP